MRIIFQLSLFLFILSSCAGYKFRRDSNPFLSQGVRSVAIPMFVNRTSLPSVSAVYTRAVHDVLSSYADLKVNSGDIENEDAVVLGIVSSARDQEIKVTTSTLMNQDQIDQIGNRNAFYLPTAADFSLNIQLIVLKRPTKEEIDFFVNYFKFSKSAFPRTIFAKTIAVSGGYSINNEVGDINTVGPLRGTQTRGNLIKSIEDSSIGLTNELREVLSNAY